MGEPIPGCTVLCILVCMAAVLVEGAELPLPQPQWSRIGDEVKLGKVIDGVAIVGYRNVYALPRVASPDFLSSISVSIESAGTADFVACASVQAVQSGLFDPFSAGNDGVCQSKSNFEVSQPLNDVQYYLLVEGALDPSLGLPTIRYTSCLTNSNCALNYNFTVSYGVCKNNTVGDDCDTTVTVMTVDKEIEVDATEPAVAVVDVQEGNSTLQLNFSLRSVEDGFQVCFGGSFGTPLVITDDTEGTCLTQISSGLNNVVLPGIGRYYWSVWTKKNGTVVDSAYRITLKSSVYECTVTDCMDPGDRVELSDEPFPVMLVNGTDVSFVVQLDSPVFSFDTTVTDVEADTAFTLDVVPFAFQNVPAAAQSTPFSERESLTGVRYTAISPSPGLWMVRLSCDTCKNDVVNLTITATNCLQECNGHGKCTDGVCACNDDFAGQSCSGEYAVTFGADVPGNVSSSDFAYFLLQTPTSTESVSVSLTANKFVAMVLQKGSAPSLTSFAYSSLDTTVEWPASEGQTWYLGVFNPGYGFINPTLSVTIHASLSLTPAIPGPESPVTSEAPLQSGKGVDTRVKIFNWADIVLSLLVLFGACGLVVWWAMRARKQMQQVEDDGDDYLRVYENAFEEDRASRAQDVVFH